MKELDQLAANKIVSFKKFKENCVGRQNNDDFSKFCTAFNVMYYDFSCFHVNRFSFEMLSFKWISIFTNKRVMPLGYIFNDKITKQSRNESLFTFTLNQNHNLQNDRIKFQEMCFHVSFSLCLNFILVYFEKWAKWF